MLSNPGTLWIVATPLGNPGDLSERARQTLSEVDIVLAEDTRRSGQLFAKCGIVARSFISLHDHNEESRLSSILELLSQGKEIALVSDAGTPLLSDPGYRLVRGCRGAGYKVSPLPGPSAPIAALCASGIAPQPFAFLGFLPRKKGEQAKTLAPFSKMPLTLVFFERKDRLFDTLGIAYSVLGNREACIARELTKTFEEFIPFCLKDHATVERDLLGEITVIIGPGTDESATQEEDVKKVIREEMKKGGKPKDIVRRVQLSIAGWGSKEIYQLMQNATASSADNE